jgi:thiazole synthase ThiGH ThiG subunit
MGVAMINEGKPLDAMRLPAASVAEAFAAAVESGRRAYLRALGCPADLALAVR